MIGVIVQARMGATRLPGKVLMEVNGVPLLKYQYDRILKSKMIDKAIIATSLKEEDDAIEQFCKEMEIPCFRGSENDVLSRYYDCAVENKLETIIRLTGDCPLVDPEVLDSTLLLFQNEKSDFGCNTVPPETSHFPDGSDVEVFSMSALTRAYHECINPHDREHVTFYFWKYDNGFKISQLEKEEDFSNYRFTVDYPEDLEVMNFLIKSLEDENKFGHINEVVSLIDSNPKIKELNSKYHFGIGWNQ